MPTLKQRINHLKRKISSKNTEIESHNAKIEKARKAIETLTAELTAANSELTALEGELLTQTLIKKGVVISEVRAAVEAGLFDKEPVKKPVSASETMEIPKTEQGDICITPEEKVTEQEENNEISDC